jgi:GAF domain-containing protein
VEAKAMANLKEPLDPATGHQIEVVLQRLRNSKDVGTDLLRVLDIAIGITGADMGTLQRFDERADCLRIVASRGFSPEALNYFGVVRRDTNTTCAAALMRRMRVFVENVSTSYLFVGTRELDMLRSCGIAAAQSTPLISSNGHLWGVFTTHFREPQIESEFDHAPLDRLAVQVTDSLEQRESLVPSQHFHDKQVAEDSQSGG